MMAEIHHQDGPGVFRDVSVHRVDETKIVHSGSNVRKLSLTHLRTSRLLELKRRHSPEIAGLISDSLQVDQLGDLEHWRSATADRTQPDDRGEVAATAVQFGQ